MQDEKYYMRCIQLNTKGKPTGRVYDAKAKEFRFMPFWEDTVILPHATKNGTAFLKAPDIEVSGVHDLIVYSQSEAHPTREDLVFSGRPTYLGTITKNLLADWRSLDLQSYDIVLCAGNGKMSRLIQHYNRVMGVDGDAATISHVAMYYHGVICAGPRRPLCFEATTLNKFNSKTGVQLNCFKNWLYNYDGKVYIRKLDFERTAFHVKKLDSFTLGQVGMPYESGIPGKIELIFTGMSIPVFSRIRKRTIEIHCSENDIEALQDGKLYLPTVHPNKMPPFEFWQGGRFETFLLKPIEIGEAIRIK